MGRCGIYSITDTKSGGIYIGSSVDIDKRWKIHLITMRSHIAPKRLQESFDSSGEGSLKMDVLAICKEENLEFLESYYMDKINPTMNLHRRGAARQSSWERTAKP